MNVNVLIAVWGVMACIGFFCIGYLFGNRRVLFWRIKWIEAEHALARAQGRKPHSISDVEKADKARERPDDTRDESNL